jgi:sulfate adenylyltransferase
VLGERGRESVLSELDDIPQLAVKEEALRDATNVATGIFSPLEGFLGEEELRSVLHEKRLPDDTPWTMPILLSVPLDGAERLSEGDECLLTASQGSCMVLLHIEERFKFDKKEIAKKVFGTTDPRHPGVAGLLESENLLLSGNVDLVREENTPFDRFRLRPAETRVLFREKNWRTIVGFQTRNPPHLGHEWIQKIALTFSDGVFINPLIGKKKSGDFRDELTLEAYDCLIENYYLKERAVLSILRTDMKYAGPREAIHHAIMRKNFGCTHFIVGRDHAGVASFYDAYAAQDMFEAFPDLRIVPMFFSSFFHCNKCGGVANDKTCPHDEKHHMKFRGTDIRECLDKGERPRKEIMREEIADILLASESPFVE